MIIYFLFKLISIIFIILWTIVFTLRLSLYVNIFLSETTGSLWSWWFGSWIYNYLCNQCLSPLALWFWIPLRWGSLDSTLFEKVCQWLAEDWWFTLSTPVSSTNKTDCRDITEILLKVVLSTIQTTNRIVTKLYLIIEWSLTMLVILCGSEI